MGAAVVRTGASRWTAAAVVTGLLLAACSSSGSSGSSTVTTPGTATSAGGIAQPAGGLAVAVDASHLPKPGQRPHFWAGLLHQAIASDPTWQVLSGPGVDDDIAKVEDKLFGQILPSSADLGTGITSASPASFTGSRVSSGAWTSGSALITNAAFVRRVGSEAVVGLDAFIGLGVTLGYVADVSAPGVPKEGVTSTLNDTVNGVDISGQLTITPSGTESTITLKKDGKTYSMTVKQSVTGDPCPDAEGKVSASFDVFVEQSGSSGANSGAGSVAIKGTVTATVDDNAEIAGVVSDGSTIRNQTLNGSVTSNSIGLHTTLDGNFQGQNVVTTYRMTTPGQAAADQEAAFARDALDGVVIGLMYERRTVWQSGACVAVSADLPEKVKRSSTTPFTVKVTHKPDGAELNAPVTAKLDNGAVSVSPDRIDKAPGQFSYTAPDAAGKKASLTFTSKSRRGIGTATVTVSTMRYVASGGSGPVSITGVVDDLDKPFDLKVTSPGAVGSVTLTPTGPTTGKIQGTSKLAFSNEVTTGSYTLKETKTGYIATGTVSTCLTAVKTCSQTGRFEVTFTAE